MPGRSVWTEWRDDVFIAWLDNPPVNAGNAALRARLVDALAEATAGHATGMVIIGDHATWVSGSDLKEFSGELPPPLLPAVIAEIERAPFTVVAAMDGHALGGGLELALGCDLRIGTERLVVGMPETELGIIPGAGGTQRLPRLVGRPLALEVIALGRRLNGGEAHARGVLDELADPSDLLPRAIEAARSVGKSRVLDRDVVSDERSLQEVMAVARKRARGRTEIDEAIRLVALSGSVPVDEALADERATFERLRLSPEAASMRHLFFAARAAGRTASRATRSLTRIGVLGAGIMGRGIAKALANNGFDVVLVDNNADALDRARVGRLPETVALSDGAHVMADRELVIEAVFEDLTVKRAALAELEAIVADDCVLASNTSYLDLNQVAVGLSRPQRFVGLHFFAPADRMRLVEVVAPKASDRAVVADVVSFARKLGKQPIIAGVHEGFVGNRILQAYRLHAEYLLEDGCLPDQVDNALTSFGFAMGPFAVADLSGLQIAWSLRKRRREEGRAPARDSVVADALCARGWFGRSVGRGYYRYVDGRPAVDPEVTEIVLAASRQRGIRRRSIGDDEIVKRCVGAMVVEAAGALADGTAARPGDIDVAMTDGFGFPRHYGGPLWWAAHLPAYELAAALDAVEKASWTSVDRSLVYDAIRQVRNAKF